MARRLLLPMHALDGLQRFIPIISNHRSVLVTRRQFRSPARSCLALKMGGAKGLVSCGNASEQRWFVVE
jgi:hypothetical protein